MKIKVDDISIYVNEMGIFNPSFASIIFLHGFAGSGKDWFNITEKISKNYFCLIPDLTGCGESEFSNNDFHYSFEFVNTIINSIIINYNISKFILCGYSMGGRLALNFSLKENPKPFGLILESTSPGLINNSDRDDRIQSDAKLIELIKLKGREGFINHWRNIELFSSMKKRNPSAFEKWLNSKNEINLESLIKWLENSGTGKMKPLWDELKNFNQPVLLINGEEDKKYSEINKLMHNLLPNSYLYEIKNSGHIVHLEKEDEFVFLCSQFLKLFN